MKPISHKHSSLFSQVLPPVLAIAISMLFPRYAVANPQTSNSTKDSTKPAAYLGLEMLTPDGGTDFSTYLKSVYDPIKKKMVCRNASFSFERLARHCDCLVASSIRWKSSTGFRKTRHSPFKQR